MASRGLARRLRGIPGHVQQYNSGSGRGSLRRNSDGCATSSMVNAPRLRTPKGHKKKCGKHVRSSSCVPLQLSGAMIDALIAPKRARSKSAGHSAHPPKKQEIRVCGLLCRGARGQPFIRCARLQQRLPGGVSGISTFSEPTSFTTMENLCRCWRRQGKQDRCRGWKEGRGEAQGGTGGEVGWHREGQA